MGNIFCFIILFTVLPIFIGFIIGNIKRRIKYLYLVIRDDKMINVVDVNGDIVKIISIEEYYNKINIYKDLDILTNNISK